jgi:hypothetical protein
MESIVWADSFDHSKDCWKLTTFCRDILTTQSMDELGQGVTPPAFQNSSNIGLVFAVLSGVLASAMVIIAVRGGFRRKRNDEYGDVQFSRVRTHEMMID